LRADCTQDRPRKALAAEMTKGCPGEEASLPGSQWMGRTETPQRDGEKRPPVALPLQRSTIPRAAAPPVYSPGDSAVPRITEW